MPAGNSPASRSTAGPASSPATAWAASSVNGAGNTETRRNTRRSALRRATDSRNRRWRRASDAGRRQVPVCSSQQHELVAIQVVQQLRQARAPLPGAAASSIASGIPSSLVTSCATAGAESALSVDAGRRGGPVGEQRHRLEPGIPAGSSAQAASRGAAGTGARWKRRAARRLVAEDPYVIGDRSSVPRTSRRRPRPCARQPSSTSNIRRGRHSASESVTATPGCAVRQHGCRGRRYSRDPHRRQLHQPTPSANRSATCSQLRPGQRRSHPARRLPSRSWQYPPGASALVRRARPADELVSERGEAGERGRCRRKYPVPTPGPYTAFQDQTLSKINRDG